uniref:Alfin N-terminal domain-containing protein n=1 Tax=Tetraselmis chuii TaxID=63592 RepID=A0A7S1SZ37_9CHLO|mmetsp:Transcript_36271/g.64905  ORF Transcript_36271/g.64905 Transcript_36271/m.64905 type:complete len:258 (+) Transcript_36271:597-1370(+)|eukprot:CAMPEP_0177765632 /NCGR_PEP_ID=MMETSP0491_2-20121128/8094_1 /TAXON_ID=63592 /ORGANISM="Tetraselmis chuii, Strain PLY429" /LENGTH=257 /DNA_ID=CAMNT_0019281991 /DNA_START=527 /DNA_END=1300 /DNA_ORIENTATION=-
MFPRTVDEICRDHRGRRAGLLMALTEDADDLYEKCDPERDNLCLYGEPDSTWMVDLPAEEVPPELPEPVLGINFARDGMDKKDWLALVAVHSDAWLMSVAFYFASKMDAAGRARIYNRINEFQTLYEVVTGKPKMKVKPSAASGSKRKKSEARTETGANGAKAEPVMKMERTVSARQPANEFPLPDGRLLAEEDISTSLIGRAAELFWPDDNLWYMIKILDVDPGSKQASIMYDTGELEDLDLIEIVKEGHMSLIAQ